MFSILIYASYELNPVIMKQRPSRDKSIQRGGFSCLMGCCPAPVHLSQLAVSDFSFFSPGLQQSWPVAVPACVGRPQWRIIIWKWYMTCCSNLGSWVASSESKINPSFIATNKSKKDFDLRLDQNLSSSEVSGTLCSLFYKSIRNLINLRN